MLNTTAVDVDTCMQSERVHKNMLMKFKIFILQACT